jgi:hypothetical protein
MTTVRQDGDTWDEKMAFVAALHKYVMSTSVKEGDMLLLQAATKELGVYCCKYLVVCHRRWCYLSYLFAFCCNCSSRQCVQIWYYFHSAFESHLTQNVQVVSGTVGF